MMVPLSTGSALFVSAHPALAWGEHWIQLSRLLPDGRQRRKLP